MSGRAQRGLADADTDASRGELGKIPGETADCRHYAPDDDAEDDHVSTRSRVGQACDRYACGRVEECEGQTREQTHRRIRDAEILFDRLEEDREDLAIYVIDDVEKDEQAQGVAGIRWAHGL